jgi:hypothetical protein
MWSTVNLQNQRILFARIETGRCHQPAVDLVIADGRSPGNILDVPQFLVAEKVVVDLGELRRRPVAAPDGDIGRSVGTARSVGIAAVVRDGERPTIVGSADRRPTDVVGQ